MAATSVFSGLAQDASVRRPERTRQRNPQAVQVRRRTIYEVVTNVTASAIATGGTYTYGGVADASDYNELLLEIIGTSLVLGSGAGLQARLETMSLKDGTWYPLPAFGSFAANPTATLSPSAGSTVMAAYGIPSPFGALLRVGFTCTTAFTSGQISAALHMKG